MGWQDRLRIVLVQSRNALNMGAAARAMANFGFSELWLVDPYDQAFRNARSAASGAWVLEKAQVTKNLSEALGEASLVVGTSGDWGRSAHHVQRYLPEAGHTLRTHLETAPAALLFGSEKFGLSNEDLSHCDWVMSIPTGEATPSMNLGQSVAVCCYELARHAKEIPELQTPARASAEQRERILQQLIPVLEKSGFLFSDSPDEQVKKIRRTLGRLRMAPADARLVQAMVHQIAWKVGQGEPGE